MRKKISNCLILIVILTHIISYPLSVAAIEISEFVDEWSATTNSSDKNENSIVEEERATELAETFHLEEEMALQTIAGFSHEETSPGVLSVITPMNATISEVVNYLKGYFQATELVELTIHGMTATGEVNYGDTVNGLGYFNQLRKVQCMDLLIVNQSGLSGIARLEELLLPKVECIEALGLADNQSLLKVEIPLCTDIGVNTFWNVGRLEELVASSWEPTVLSALGREIHGTTESLKIIDSKRIVTTTSGLVTESFPNLEQQTIRETTRLDEDTGVIFENISRLILPEVTVVDQSWMKTSSIEYIGLHPSKNITIKENAFSNVTSLREIDADFVVAAGANAFYGTTIEKADFFGSVSGEKLAATNFNSDSFLGAEQLTEIHLPNIGEGVDYSFRLADSVELVTTPNVITLRQFTHMIADSTHALFMNRDESLVLKLVDEPIVYGETKLLEASLNEFVLNETLSTTNFEIRIAWFYNHAPTGFGNTLTIDSGGFYQYEVTLINRLTQEQTIRHSRTASIEVINEIDFFKTRNYTEMIGTASEWTFEWVANKTIESAQISLELPKEITVNNQAIVLESVNTKQRTIVEQYMIVDNQLILSDLQLSNGEHYKLFVPIMPTALKAEGTHELNIAVEGGQTLRTSYLSTIQGGGFNLVVSEQMTFNEQGLDQNDIHTLISKKQNFELTMTDFRGIQDNWKLSVQAQNFKNSSGEEVPRSALNLVYRENEEIHTLDYPLLLVEQQMEKISYDFELDSWQNAQFDLQHTTSDGFLIQVGESYHLLTDYETYQAEIIFNIEFSP